MLQQQQSTLIPSTETVTVETGETFGEVLETDPRRVVKQVIETLILSPPIKKGAERKLNERVVIDWKDTNAA